MTRTREENALDGMWDELAERVDVLALPKKAPKYYTLEFSFGIRQIMAGPYRDKPNGNPGICLTENRDECAIHCPIKDFGVPDADDVEAALAATLALMAYGEVPYVGCGWGQGRTGLFLALLTKVADRTTTPFWQRPPDPVKRVRAAYNEKAVETKQQQKFVDDFSTRRLAKLSKYL